MNFNKLVRDKIIKNWNPKYGKNPKFHIANDDEYYNILLTKLSEEIKEFTINNEAEELADILEIIYSICEIKQITLEELEIIRKEKLNQSGGFKRRIILENSED